MAIEAQLIWSVLFFVSIFLLTYVYVGYPLLVLIAGKFFNRAIIKDEQYPKITIVIPAFNEEQCIKETISNKLRLDYPKSRIEIIVISDGSTDETDAIVQSFAPQGVKLLRQGARAGKTSALNLAVPKAKGEIIVFSDANSLYANDALKALVANFSDPSVGYVTGKMIYTNSDGTIAGDGCSSYMRYENFLREHETLLGSIVGVDGGVDAIRKQLYVTMRQDQLPDFILPLAVVNQGFRVVYEPLAILKEPALKSTQDEYRMRVRVSLRALWALFDMRCLLIPYVNPIFSWQIWSHKLLRYLCFLFLALAYLSNFILLNVESGLYKYVFVVQNLLYLGALSPLVLERVGVRLSVLRLLHYFCLINLASGHAAIKFLLRQKTVFWTPRKG